MLNIVILLCIAAATRVNAKKVCYGDLGCFTDDHPFHAPPQRAFSLLPESPEKIGTTFSLYTRANAAKATRITAASIPATYNAKIGTKFITHGFVDTGSAKWVIRMKDAILKAEDMNVIVVNWSKGSQFPYTQATANTQVVGAEIAKLIKALVANRGANLVDFHLIGHSLGAHTSGYAGRFLAGKVGRITGLDPAGPYFEDTDPIVRLDPTDAIYVDAIHTDANSAAQLGLGMMQAVGHTDFYPNGGRLQPGCSKTVDKLLSAIFQAVTFNLGGAADILTCSHMVAIKYFTDSISFENDPLCKYTSYACNSIEDFKLEKCQRCSAKGCNRMGYWSRPTYDTGKLYLQTQSPNGYRYCKQR
jgi:pimeloyl-ACP methyl ester carboxylesterase